MSDGGGWPEADGIVAKDCFSGDKLFCVERTFHLFAE